MNQLAYTLNYEKQSITFDLTDPNKAKFRGNQNRLFVTYHSTTGGVYVNDQPLSETGKPVIKDAYDKLFFMHTCVWPEAQQPIALKKALLVIDDYMNS